MFVLISGPAAVVSAVTLWWDFHLYFGLQQLIYVNFLYF